MTNKLEESIKRLENLVGGIQTSVVRNAEAIELIKQQLAKKMNKPKKEVKKVVSKRSTKKRIRNKN